MATVNAFPGSDRKNNNWQELSTPPSPVCAHLYETTAILIIINQFTLIWLTLVSVIADTFVATVVEYEATQWEVGDIRLPNIET